MKGRDNPLDYLQFIRWHFAPYVHGVDSALSDAFGRQGAEVLERRLDNLIKPVFSNTCAVWGGSL